MGESYPVFLEGVYTFVVGIFLPTSGRGMMEKRLDVVVMRDLALEGRVGRRRSQLRHSGAQ